MNERKHLEFKGKDVEHNYDLKHDVLFLRVTTRKYDYSIEVPDFDVVVDVDTDGYPIGLQLFEASRNLGVPKEALRNLTDWRFDIFFDKGKIAFTLQLHAKIRNKVMAKDFKCSATSEAFNDLARAELGAAAIPA
jgi:uncharacterized protein YuzE